MRFDRRHSELYSRRKRRKVALGSVQIVICLCCSPLLCDRTGIFLCVQTWHEHQSIGQSMSHLPSRGGDTVLIRIVWSTRSENPEKE